MRFGSFFGYFWQSPLHSQARRPMEDAVPEIREGPFAMLKCCYSTQMLKCSATQLKMLKCSKAEMHKCNAQRLTAALLTAQLGRERRGSCTRTSPRRYRRGGTATSNRGRRHGTGRDLRKVIRGDPLKITRRPEADCKSDEWFTAALHVKVSGDSYA